MTKFILVTESGSDIPQEYAHRYNIQIVPMHVTFNGQTHDDGTVHAPDIFNHYEESGVLPTTSGSTPDDFDQVFKKISQEYPDHEIIYIAYSAVTTVSFNSARLAAENYQKIHLIDSKNCSMGLGAIVIATAQFIEANPQANVEDVISYVELIREKTRFVFLPHTLLYLHAGGRISNASYIGAKLLRIFPTIELKDGYLVAGTKYRGSFKKAFQKMIDDLFVRHLIDKTSIKMVGIAGMTQIEKEDIEMCLHKHGVSKVEWFEAGAVIACHGGPGAVGIVAFDQD